MAVQHLIFAEGRCIMAAHWHQDRAIAYGREFSCATGLPVAIYREICGHQELLAEFTADGNEVSRGAA